MPITEQQRKERKNYLGDSDVPALFGADKYKTAYGLWMFRTGKLEEEEPVTEPQEQAKSPAYLGTIFEEPIIQWAEGVLGPIKRDVEVWNPDGLNLVGHLDGLRRSGLEPVEAKSLWHADRTGWGESGSEEVPDRTYLQCQAHILNCGRDKVCNVPALLLSRLTMYYVEPNPEVMDAILAKVAAFEECVQRDEPPQNVLPNIGEVKRMRRKVGKTVAVNQELVGKCQKLREEAKQIKKEKEIAEAELLAKMGDAEYGINLSGPDVTYYEQERKAYEVKASKYRVLRFVKK